MADERMAFLGVVPRLEVGELERSLAFYRDLLGFRLCSEWPEHEPTFAILERDGVELQLSVAEPRAAPGRGCTLYFDVRDAMAIHARLRDRLQIEWGPEVYSYGRRELAVRDPDGVLVIFSEAADDELNSSGNRLVSGE